MRVGIFGGTFDPPHIGHLVVAQEVHHRLGLDRVLWIPAAIPPHKQGEAITPGPIRLEMVRAAIAGDERFAATDVELRRPGTSYTVDTLRELRAERPDDRMFLILGADQLSELDSWREPDEIRLLATIVGFAREGETPPRIERVRIVQVPRIDLASTELRRRVGTGEPIRFLVAERVDAIIRREGLYQAAEGG